MQLMPLYEKIVVFVKEKQEVKSSSGIVVQRDMSQSTNTTMIGEVVAVGEGRLLQDGDIRPLTVKVGDNILFTKMSGESFNDGNKDYIIMSESNVLAIIKND